MCSCVFVLMCYCLGSRVVLTLRLWSFPVALQTLTQEHIRKCFTQDTFLRENSSTFATIGRLQILLSIEKSQDRRHYTGL